METSTWYTEGKRFETYAGRHLIVTDQPSAAGGTDAGPTPPELLLAALGTCAGHYAVEYLRARSLSADGLHVYVSADKAAAPARLSSFRIEVDMPGLDAKQREGLTRAVKSCLIHNTLSAPPAIQVTICSCTPFEITSDADSALPACTIHAAPPQ
jgi:uncharacterized OsmC-like protein